MELTVWNCENIVSKILCCSYVAYLLRNSKKQHKCSSHNFMLLVPYSDLFTSYLFLIVELSEPDHRFETTRSTTKSSYCQVSSSCFVDWIRSYIETRETVQIPPTRCVQYSKENNTDQNSNFWECNTQKKHRLHLVSLTYLPFKKS